VEGMLGSLDCMHTHWKNCPVAWHQSCKGKERGKATVVLEAVADHNLWFWHAAYGFAGALNDLNILCLSPLMRRITDGTFTKIEEASEVVPFLIDGTEVEFDRCFFLCDGIYPKYSRFVKGMKQPIGEGERRFTAWQESARKDIERAFGVLQCKFKAISSPIYLINEKAIANMVGCCLILHNMAVSDRVMVDVTKRYDPGSTHATPEKPKDVLPLPEDRVGLVGDIPLPVAVTALTHFDREVASLIVQRKELKGLLNDEEWKRLQGALVTLKGGSC
jgi:Plant transposon protein